ncbi:MAG: tRNA threonylcarbamoyladenosine biosynthesis protein TsaB [Candidatus Azotimanducaceae bacterium]|jgi:tRNA threonylcarbamoyladenosine biosynthesis protein TsaB
MTEENSESPKRILAIDTSTKACVLGLSDSVSGETKTATEIVGRTHSEVILPKIMSLLEDCNLTLEDLDLIVYGKGPGSFTGLRIGVGVVQGLAFGLNIPVVGISSLACMAQQVFRLEKRQHAIVALTARLQEVYHGSYSEVDGIMTLVGKEGVCEASRMPPRDKKLTWVGTGSGWVLRSEIETGVQSVVDKVFDIPHPNAIDLLSLGVNAYQKGLFGDAISAQPEYLRETVADLPNRTSSAAKPASNSVSKTGTVK